jgi:two-component system sensor histidine kinase and response regulator WspE
VSAIIIKCPQGPFAILVDEIVGQEDVVAQPIDRRLQHLPYIAAVATLNRGSVVVVIDSDDIAVAIQRLATRHDGLTINVGSAADEKRQQVLIVDDSLTVRELERKLLTDAGYDVTVALDGLDGLQQVALKDFDLLVTDVDMPRMNGFELIETLRKNPRYASIPTVVVSYKERPEDKRRGLECGADAYLTKESFHDDTFIKTVQDLLRR